MPRPTDHRFLTTAVRAGVLMAATSLIGCQQRPGLPRPVESVFQGPEISLDSSGPEHVLVCELPSPGWQFTVDATREALKHRQVLATLRRPQPAVAYPQVIVTQRSTTGVRTPAPVVIYARVIDFDDRAPTTPYERVTTIEAVPVAPPTESP